MTKLSRISIVAIACALGAIAFVIVLVLGAVGDNSDQTKNLQRRLETAPPVSVKDLKSIEDKIETNRDSIQENAAKIEENAADPHIVVTVVPAAGVAGPQGEAGATGATGSTGPTGRPGSAGRVVKQQAQPTRQPTTSPAPRASPKPSCALGGLVKLGTIC